MTPVEAGQPDMRPPPPRLRPRLGVADLAVHLWRSKWLMLLVFLPLVALGLFAAVALPERYTATARLIVAPGTELPGENGTDIARSEMELMRSPIVIEAALQAVTLARAYPGIARSCIGDDCVQQGSAAISEAYAVEPAPGDRAIVLGFTHDDPAVAADLLNALVATYLDYRPAVLGEEMALNYGAQNRRFEKEVADSDSAIRDYLMQNGLTGLEIERNTLSGLHSAANAALMQAATRQAEVDAELAIWRRRAKSLSERDVLYSEDASRQRLQTLQIEREEKRAHLAPHDPALRDLDWRIERLQAFLDDQDTPAGLLRRGVNPLWQEAQSAVARLEAEAGALVRQQTELHTQLASIEARQLSLISLAPDLEALERRREAAAEGARRFAALAASARARTDLARDGAGNVRLIAPAAVPSEGQSLRVPAAFMALLLSALAALVAGLAHAMSQASFATPRSLERTTGLPVLATVSRY